MDAFTHSLSETELHVCLERKKSGKIKSERY